MSISRKFTYLYAQFAMRRLSRMLPFWFLRILPKSVCVLLIPWRAMAPFMAHLVQQGQCDTAVRYIILRLHKKTFGLRWKQRLMGTPRQPDIERRPVFIVGPVRMGKTTIANQVIDRLGYIPVPADAYNHIMTLIRDEERRDEFRLKMLDALVTFRPEGKVFDGIGLFTLDNHRDPSQRRLVSLEPALTLAKKHNGVLAVVGSAGATVEAKMAAIKSHRENHACWTSTMKDAWLVKYVKQMIDLSGELLEAANTHGLAYYELRVEHHAEDVAKTATAICEAVTKATRPAKTGRKAA